MTVSWCQNFGRSQTSLRWSALLDAGAFFEIPQIIFGGLAEQSGLVYYDRRANNDSLGGADAPLVLAWSI